MDIQVYRSIQLESITLTNGTSTTRKISSQGAFSRVRFRLSATTTGGTPTGLNRYEGLAVLPRLRWRAGGRIIWDLNPGEVFKRQQFLAGTRPERIAASTTPGAWAYSFEVLFGLPPPFRFPDSGVTWFPSGILPNIELEVVPATDMMAALYTGVSTTTFSAGPALTVTIETADVDNSTLAEMVREGQIHAYQQLSQTDSPTATGQRDVLLTSGSGIMTELYVSNAMATALAFSDTMVGETSVIVGANNFTTQSRFLELQNRAREDYAAADPVINTGLNTTGAHIINCAPNGQLGEGVDLNGQQSLRLRQVIDTLTNSTGRTETIQGIFLPRYWDNVALVGVG